MPFTLDPDGLIGVQSMDALNVAVRRFVSPLGASVAPGTTKTGSLGANCVSMGLELRFVICGVGVPRVGVGRIDATNPTAAPVAESLRLTFKVTLSIRTAFPLTAHDGRLR